MKKSFTKWLARVDGILVDLTGKPTSRLPIPLETWEELYEQGMSPLDAAKGAIRLIFEIGVPEPKEKDN